MEATIHASSFQLESPAAEFRIPTVEGHLMDVTRQVRHILTSAQNRNGCFGDLKNVGFKWNRPVSYSNPFIQAYYTLKYYGDFMDEYCAVYDNICRFLSSEPEVSVLSLGCGSCVDFSALLYAHSPGQKISYRGVDVVNWRIRPDFEFYPYSFTQANVANITDIDPFTNVIFFPRSISDFDAKSFDALLRILGSFQMHTAKLALAIGYTSHASFLERDAARFSRVLNCFVRRGFHIHPDDYARVRQYRTCESLKTGWGEQWRKSGVFEEFAHICEELIANCPNQKANNECCGNACHDLRAAASLVHDTKWQVIRLSCDLHCPAIVPLA
ncbi:MAG: hypothetical protein JXR76_24960 [Deltaproteobacteria bacterium]|nr:hypothetical protein [Deltaproteobacteria bacterium]